MKRLRNLGIHARGDGIKIFHHGHFRAQPRVDRPQFKADHARTDHGHVLRDTPQRESACRGDDGLFIDRDTRQRTWLGSGCDHNRLCAVKVVAHPHLTRRRKIVAQPFSQVTCSS